MSGEETTEKDWSPEEIEAARAAHESVFGAPEEPEPETDYLLQVQTYEPEPGMVYAPGFERTIDIFTITVFTIMLSIAVGYLGVITLALLIKLVSTVL